MKKVNILAFVFLTMVSGSVLLSAQDYGDHDRDHDAYRQRMRAASITVQGDTVSWQSEAPNAIVYVEEDQQPSKVFASGTTGSQSASWMERGHVYVFTLRDANGSFLSRTQVDLRK